MKVVLFFPFSVAVSSVDFTEKNPALQVETIFLWQDTEEERRIKEIRKVLSLWLVAIEGTTQRKHCRSHRHTDRCPVGARILYPSLVVNKHISQKYPSPCHRDGWGRHHFSLFRFYNAAGSIMRNSVICTRTRELQKWTMCKKVRQLQRPEEKKARKQGSMMKKTGG